MNITASEHSKGARGSGAERDVNQDLAKTQSEIKGTAIGLLARREHSKYELIKKLSRKYFDVDAVACQVDKLAEQDMQSDQRFVESFVRTRKNNGKGPKLIKQELSLRGVSQYLIESYVYEGDDDWLNLAEQVHHKKFGDAPVGDMKEKARRIRFMVSRGFSSDIVFRILDR